MGVLDVEQLLEPISPEESPCGEDLEYDARIRRIRTGRPACRRSGNRATPWWKAKSRIGGPSAIWRRGCFSVPRICGSRSCWLVPSLTSKGSALLAMLSRLSEVWWSDTGTACIRVWIPTTIIDPTFRVNTLLACAIARLACEPSWPLRYVESRCAGQLPIATTLSLPASCPREGRTAAEMSDDRSRPHERGSERLLADDGRCRMRAIACGPSKDAVTVAVGVGRSASLEPLESPLNKMSSPPGSYLERRGFSDAPGGRFRRVRGIGRSGRRASTARSWMRGGGGQRSFQPPASDEVRSAGMT